MAKLKATKFLKIINQAVKTELKKLQNGSCVFWNKVKRDPSLLAYQEIVQRRDVSQQESMLSWFACFANMKRMMGGKTNRRKRWFLGNQTPICGLQVSLVCLLCKHKDEYYVSYNENLHKKSLLWNHNDTFLADIPRKTARTR